MRRVQRMEGGWISRWGEVEERQLANERKQKRGTEAEARDEDIGAETHTAARRPTLTQVVEDISTDTGTHPFIHTYTAGTPSWEGCNNLTILPGRWPRRSGGRGYRCEAPR